MRTLYLGVFAAAFVASSSSANYRGLPDPPPPPPAQPSPPPLPQPLPSPFTPPFTPPPLVPPPPQGPFFERPGPPCAFFCEPGADPSNPAEDLPTYEEMNPNTDKIPSWQAIPTEPVD
jgi:hypothetical protein